MVTSASIEVSYRCEDGWHIFKCKEMPGLYVAHRDPRQGFLEVGPAIEKLVKLDTDMDVRVAPEVSFAAFIGSARSALASAVALQRFNLFKEAA